MERRRFRCFIGEDLSVAGVNPVGVLASKIENGTGTMLIDTFSFGAVATSFIGFTIGLKTFIADGLSSIDVKSEPVSYSLTLIPPLTFAITYPDVFISAVDNAGTFGVIVIFGLLPPLMVYSYRKSAKEEVFAAKNTAGRNAGQKALDRCRSFTRWQRDLIRRIRLFRVGHSPRAC